MKTKFLRANYASFIAKELPAAIMPRSILGKKYLNEKSDDATLFHKKQRNVDVFLLTKAKQKLYESFRFM